MKNDLNQQLQTILSMADFKYGIMVKINNQIQFQKDADELFSSASLIKLAIVNCALESSIDFKSEIKYSNADLVGGSGVLQLLSIREMIFGDLLGLMISDSDNSATNIVIRQLSMTRINDWLANHHFNNTQLNRLLMDARALGGGVDNYTTANESLALLQRALQFKEGQRWTLNQQFRYKLPGNFDESGLAVQVFNKTGEGNQIDHDVARFIVGENTVDIALLTANSIVRSDTIHLFNKIGQTLINYVL